jgi:hypothetical protein
VLTNMRNARHVEPPTPARASGAGRLPGAPWGSAAYCGASPAWEEDFKRFPRPGEVFKGAVAHLGLVRRVAFMAEAAMVARVEVLT